MPFISHNNIHFTIETATLCHLALKNISLSSFRAPTGFERSRNVAGLVRSVCSSNDIKQLKLMQTKPQVQHGSVKITPSLSWNGDS